MACFRALDAVILAGGQGSRLQPVLTDCAKVMAPIQGRPFLEHLVEHLAAFGVRRVILALGYRHETVLRHLDSYRPSGVSFFSSIEREPLGTGGSLRHAAQYLRSDRALVLNGDSLTRADLCAFLRFHETTGARWSMLLTHCEQADRYAVVTIDGEGRVTGFDPASPSGRGFISTGVYLAERDAIDDWVPAHGPVSLERDVFPRRCGDELRGWGGRFAFIDIGTPESYRAAETFFAPTAAVPGTGGAAHDH